MRFIGKYELNFALLSDTDGTVCRQYGTCEGDGMIDRSTIIIDEEGKITKVYTNVRPLGHAMKVLLCIE